LYQEKGAKKLLSEFPNKAFELSDTNGVHCVGNLRFQC